MCIRDRSLLKRKLLFSQHFLEVLKEIKCIPNIQIEFTLFFAKKNGTIQILFSFYCLENNSEFGKHPTGKQMKK